MIVGASPRRKEDPRLLAGRGRYVGDVRLPGMVEAVVVRSAHAHAMIRSIEASSAQGVPGVVLIATAADLGEIGSIPIRLGPKPALLPFLQYVLPRERVRYVGEPVALVVAADRYAAEDAADRLAVDYGVLPAVATTEQALRPDAPVLHGAGSLSAPDGGALARAAGPAHSASLPFRTQAGRPSEGNLAERLLTVVGDPDRALATAEVRIRHRFTIQRHTGVPLETRGLVAAYDPDGGMLTVWGPTKVPHFNRKVLAGLLGWPVDRIRFVEPDVGGGFGVRGEFYPEDFLVPWAALRLGRPVKWIEDRREHMIATNHSRQQTHEVEVGATRDGRLVALVDRVVADLGAYLRTHGVTVPELTAAMLPGPYRIPHYRCEVLCVMTNKTPTGTYRSPGRYEANFVRERIIDLLADAVGLDPVEIRRRNLVPAEAMPYTVGTTGLGEPTIYDTGAYASALETALRTVDYGGLRLRQTEVRRHGRHLGIGLACVVEKAGPGPWEIARVTLGEGGRATVYSGAASLGQGLETILAQICAEELGVSMDDVTVIHGDTAAIAEGVGAWGSRATVVAGSAASLAARAVKHQLLERAARRLEAAPDDLVVGGGRVWVRGVPARAIAVADLLTAPQPEISATHTFHVSKMTYPYGTHVAVVEVDPETGRIELLDYGIAYDVGKAVNPRLVEGQLAGGLAQGIGGAILEELAYDEGGQPQATTFMDYLLPTTMEVPEHLSISVLEECPTPLNPLGVKGAGEGGTAGAGAAIANAVADALRPWGARITDLPLSPARIVSATRSATRVGR